MIKTIQQFFIQIFSKQSVSFKSKSTDRQLSGQHLCITFNIAEVFWVLEQTTESFFMSNASARNTTSIFAKNHRERRTFC